MKRFKTSPENYQVFKNSLSTKWKNLFYRQQGTPLETNLAPYKNRLDQIRAVRTKSVPDSALKQKSAELTDRARSGDSLEHILVDAYALVCEVSQRTIGLDPHDVQIIAGLAMHGGKIAELPTGEGKTLAAVLPAYLNALEGKGFHVLTFNDYLARRDASWMGPIFSFLGQSVGCVQEGRSPSEKRKAYACDITYATAKEVGFDFLRDHLCYKREDLVHRPFHFALIDEADSILIDEARIPLVIAGITEESTSKSYGLAKIIKQLEEGKDFETDDENRNIYLTDTGLKRMERLLGCSNLHSAESIDLLTAINCALHTEILLQRDKDYIVRNGKIEIVDEFTGRVVDKRHWPDGLQAAVEAKENLKFKSDGIILGSITLQHFFQLYPRLCGMTATARTASNEINEFYNLSISVIPPHRACIRFDHPDRVFETKAAKRKALIEEIKGTHATGRPILVGTSSVEESEKLAADLRKAGIPCQVLNAKNDEKEAKIIAQAGELGAATISTNMAGRGTDIKLGGSQEEHHDEVAALGGMYVIGTNRHESLRIDNQLRGRAGRQGDPGSSRFFISLEDDLIRRYGMQKFNLSSVHSNGSAPPELENPWINKEIMRTQRIIEGQNFEIRKTLWKYSSLIEMQREAIHRKRQNILLSNPMPSFLESRSPEIFRALLDSLGEDRLQSLEKQVSLVQMDRHWADHLAWIADTRESIHLVSLSGKEPLEQFQMQATKEFLNLGKRIDEKIENTFKAVLSAKDGIDISGEDFKGPSSTWTYLINDEQFDWGIRMLKGKNIGYTAAAAAWWGPLYLILGIYHRFFKKRKE